MKLKRIVYFLIAVMSLKINALAEDKVVKLSTLYGYEPYTYLNNESDGGFTNEKIKPGANSSKLLGFTWDVVRQSFHAVDYTIILSVVPWARAMKMFESGEVDSLFPTTKNAEREKKYDYSTHYTNSAGMVIYVTKDSSMKWNGLESLVGKDIGVRINFSYGQKWDTFKGINKKPVVSDAINFKKLAGGRIDGVAGYDIIVDRMLIKRGMQDQFKRLPAFDFNREYIVTLKSNKKGKKIISAFDRGKQKIIDSGLYKKILEKWKISGSNL